MQEKGKISFWSAVLMSINIIVGAGIFIGPPKIVAIVGSIGFVAYLFAGLMFLPIVWGVAQASSLFPGTGGLYNYAATGLGRPAGFISQWIYTFGYLGSAATIMVALREAVISTFDVPWLANYALPFNAAVIGFFCLLNLLSVPVISKIQSSFTLIKLLPIVFVVAVFAFYWNPTLNYSMDNVAKLGKALAPAFFAFLGFEACCSIAHYLEGGPQQVGKVMLTAFGIATTLNMLFCLGVIHIMGPDALIAEGSTTVFPNYMGFSPAFTKVLALGITGSIFVSFLNSIFGIIFTCVSNLDMLAQKNLVIGAQPLSTTTKQGRPWVIIAFAGAVIWTLLYLIHSLVAMSALTNIGVAIAFTLTLLAVLRAQTKARSIVPLFLTLLGLASCFMLLYFSWLGLGKVFADRIANVIPIFVGLAVGLILYILRKKDKHTQGAI